MVPFSNINAVFLKMMPLYASIKRWNYCKLKINRMIAVKVVYIFILELGMDTDSWHFCSSSFKMVLWLLKAMDYKVCERELVDDDILAHLPPPLFSLCTSIKPPPHTAHPPILPHEPSWPKGTRSKMSQALITPRGAGISDRYCPSLPALSYLSNNYIYYVISWSISPPPLFARSSMSISLFAFSISLVFLSVCLPVCLSVCRSTSVTLCLSSPLFIHSLSSLFLSLPLASLPSSLHFFPLLSFVPLPCFPSLTPLVHSFLKVKNNTKRTFVNVSSISFQRARRKGPFSTDRVCTFWLDIKKSRKRGKSGKALGHAYMVQR